MTLLISVKKDESVRRRDEMTKKDEDINSTHYLIDLTGIELKEI